MEFEVKEAVELPDGAHQGVITEVQYRNEPYKYTDVIIETPLGDTHMKVKYGCPTPDALTIKTKLGRLLLAFGFNMSVGAKVSPNSLVGKHCVFVTMKKQTAKGEYVEIVGDSVKPMTPQSPSEVPPTAPEK